MGLFTPIWMTENSKKAKQAANYIKKHHASFSQAELYQMVKDLPLPEVRHEALMHITEDDILVSIVQDETIQEEHRITAAKKIQSLEENDLLGQHFYTGKIKSALFESRKQMVGKLLYQLEYGSAREELAERIIRFSTSCDIAEKAYAYLPKGYSRKRLESIDEHQHLLRYYDSYTMNKITEEENRMKNRTPEEIQYEDACARDGI